MSEKIGVTTLPATEEYEAELQELRKLLQLHTSVQWEIGDLLIKMVRTDDPNTGIREIAAQVGRTEGELSSWRNVAKEFPPDSRKFDVPWGAYHYVLNEKEFAEPILQLYVEKTTQQPPKRSFSKATLRQCVLDVREQAQTAPLSQHFTDGEKFERSVARYTRKIQKGPLPTITEMRNIIASMKVLEDFLQPLVSRSQRHGG